MLSKCIRGDATKPEAWRQVLAGRTIDALITDPPYCLLTRRRKGGDLRDPKGRKIDSGPVRRFETVRDYRAFTQGWMQCAVDHLAPTAPMVIWTNLLGREPIISTARDSGFLVLGEFVWGKRTRQANSGEEVLRVVETAWVFSRVPLEPLTPESVARPWAVVAGYDDDQEAARWGNHPNHKPFGVLEPLIRTWSRPGQLLMDPFCGSGSIPAAALRLGRDVRGLEIEPEWASRVEERLNA